MIARRIADYLGEKLGLDAETRDVVRFGAENLLLSCAGLGAVTLVAWLLGCPGEALAVTGVVIALRSLAGGAHLGAPLRCTLFTAMVFPALGRAAQALAAGGHLVAGFSAGAAVLCLAAVALLAPVDSPAKPIRTAAHRRRLRRLAILAVLAVALVTAALLATGASRSLAAALGTGLLWQAFILTRAGHAALRFVDRLSASALCHR
ncbi:MAG: accessory gene regulator B family protein [Bacillota bacterium]